jgi:hypothetical protein
MACLLRPRTGLSPPGDAGVYQSRVPALTFVGSEAKALGDPRAEPFEQDIGFVDQLPHTVEVVEILEIGCHDPSATQLSTGGARSRTLDSSHLGTEVGQQHRGVRARTHARQFDDVDTGQRTRRYRRTALNHATRVALI